MIQREAMEAEIKKEGEFKSYAENLHHLVSTRQIRGIYNPREELLEVRLENDDVAFLPFYLYPFSC
jgi:hypothetical protein